MTDLQREALAVLAETWSLSPEVRLGQLMAHLGFLGEVHLGKSLDYIEDDELVAVLYRHRAELKSRTEGAPHEPPQPSGGAMSVSESSTLPITAQPGPNRVRSSGRASSKIGETPHTQP
jgi:hypothetical protein